MAARRRVGAAGGAERAERRGPPARSREAGATARDRAILDAALERFVHYGFRRTALEDIAGDAGISRAAIYLRFANKEALFRALARELQEDALAAAEAAAGAEGLLEVRLRGVLEAKFGRFFELLRRSPHAGEILGENERLGGDISAASARRTRALLRRLFEEAAARGEIDPARAGLSAAAAAELVYDCARGLELASDVAPAEQRRRLASLARVVALGFGGEAGRASAPRRTARR